MLSKAVWSTSSKAAGKSESTSRTPESPPWLMTGITISDCVLRKAHYSLRSADMQRLIMHIRGAWHAKAVVPGWMYFSQTPSRSSGWCTTSWICANMDE